MEGDLVFMEVGEQAGAKVMRGSLILSRGDKFILTDASEPDSFDRLYSFKVLETPISDILHSLVAHRPLTTTAQLVRIILQILFHAIWIVYLLSFFINLGRTFIDNSIITHDSLYNTLLRNPLYPLLPLISAPYPVILLIHKSYSNAYIQTLFQALQSSKTEFQDKEDVDEFDAAPAPTKELILSWMTVFKRLLEGTSSNMIDSLATTTVLCAIDREGTISSPIQAIDQIYVCSATLDVSYNQEFKFEDEDWTDHLRVLKPLAVATGRSCGRKELHMHKGKACICQLGKEVGTPVYTERVLIESDVTVRLVETEENEVQVFVEGATETILSSCLEYWNGTELRDISEIRESLLDFYQNAQLADLQVKSYAYRPLQNHSSSEFLPEASTVFRSRCEDEDQLVSLIDSVDTLTLDQIYQESRKALIFLGAVSFLYPPKANMVDFVEDLGLAGIRFVYFSSSPEQESKSYAERLGLEIDWNSCIILSKEGRYKASHDIQSQLPLGVGMVRDHLAKVDDVPLHVSLFAECSPASIQEMIAIFQEHGEVCCSIGSSLNTTNVDSFARSDISIAVDPVAIKRTNPLSCLQVAASLNVLTCAVTLNSDLSLYSVTQMIRESRSLFENGKQAFTFYLGAQIALSFAQLLSYFALLPGLFTGYQIMFLIWIITPLLSVSILFSPHMPEIMTYIPAKNSDHWKDVSQFSLSLLARFAFIPVFGSLGIYWLLLIFLASGPFPQLTLESPLTLFIQNFEMFLFTLQLVAISATFIHRIDSIFLISPLINRVWVAVGILWYLLTNSSISLQILFFYVSIGNTAYLSQVPYWIYLSALGVLLLTCVVQEVVKGRDKLRWVVFQKRSKLEFNTKLGMHSPL